MFASSTSGDIQAAAEFESASAQTAEDRHRKTHFKQYSGCLNSGSSVSYHLARFGLASTYGLNVSDLQYVFSTVTCSVDNV